MVELVVTVNFVEPADAPAIVTGFVVNEQAGAGMPPPVILLQERVIFPVKPLTGVSMMVEVAEFPALMELGANAVAAME